MTTAILILGIAGIFAGLFLSLTAMGVFTNEARGVSKSLAVMEAFSAAPEAMKKELDPSFNDRVLTPVLGRFVGLGRRLTPNDYAERIQSKLDVAGNPPGMTVDRIVSLKVVGIGVGVGAGVLLAVLLDWSAARWILAAAGGGVLGYYAPNLYLYQKGHDRT
jgi:tight adherence protein C